MNKRRLSFWREVEIFCTAFSPEVEDGFLSFLTSLSTDMSASTTTAPSVEPPTKELDQVQLEPSIEDKEGGKNSDDEDEGEEVGDATNGTGTGELLFGLFGN